MKWNDPITGKAGTVVVDVVLLETHTVRSVLYQQPYDMVSSCGEYVSKLLDSQVTIQDASIGRMLFRGSLLALALWRLEAAGLKQPEPLPRYETPSGHLPYPCKENPAVCVDCGYHVDEHGEVKVK
jgi:hypothetical protein